MAVASRTRPLPRTHLTLGAVLALRDFIPTLLHDVPVEDPADEQAFDRFAAGAIRQLGLVGAVVLLFATLAWWPLDGWVLPGRDDVDVFARMRAHAAVFELVCLAVLALTPARTPGFALLSVVLYAALMFTFTEGLGKAGLDPAGADPLTWLADVWIGIVPLAVLPLRTLTRVFAVLLTIGAVWLGFFGMHPTNLRLPGAMAQVSFALFAGLFTVAAGEGSTRLARRAFFERRALDRARAALEDWTDTLTAQVAERTRALRLLTQHLEDAQEAERRRLAHDLHDDLGQSLTAMRYALARLGARIADDEATAGIVQDLDTLLDGTTRATRGVVARLRPRILDDLGLAAALEWFCEDLAMRTGVACSLDLSERGPADALDAAAQLALFRAVQEGSTNALRHGEASSVAVALRGGDGQIVVTVRDDGRGFVVDDAPNGFGLLGLSERFGALGGSFLVESAPGKGTTLMASVPMKKVVG